MCLWSVIRKVPRFHGAPKRNRSQSWESEGHLGNDIAQNCERSLQIDRTRHSFEQVCVERYRQVLALLQDTQASFRVDWRMRNSFQELEGILNEATTLEPFSKMRRPFFCILQSLRQQWVFYQKRKQGVEASVLHKRSLLRCKSKIPSSREGVICIDCSIKEALSILPSTSYHRYDRPTYQESHE